MSGVGCGWTASTLAWHGTDNLMTLLITGGAGFVMSNLARHWLESDSDASAIIVDAAPLDALAERFFAPVRERLTFIQGDVTDSATWQSLGGRGITGIAHGATITPSTERERASPKQVVDVNLMGTVQALEFARRQTAFQRFIYVSSGSVYGEALPSTPDVPVPEDGLIAPIELYAITKYASELITRRYAELFGLQAASVRLSGVYGPMDRVTPARAVECVPNKIVHLALAGRPVRVKALEAGGDFIHVTDVAMALALLLRALRLRHDIYNIAYGEFSLIRELIEIVGERVPGLTVEVVAGAEADIAYDPRQRLARWGDYDISRLREELGWRPRPLRQALHSYIDWIQTNEPGWENYTPGAPASVGRFIRM